MKQYVLGVDGGTESFRAGVFDVSTGVCAGFGIAENLTTYPAAGYAEQSVDRWDAALVHSIRAAIASSGVPAEEIGSVGIDGTTCTLVLLDERGAALRPALLWMDVRAAAEAREITEVAGQLSCAGGGLISAEWFPPKALWLKRNEAEIYSRTRTLFEQTDWIAFRLTGETTLNINTITARWLYNAREGGWPLSLFDAVGLGEVAERFPPRIVRVGEPVGGLSAEMASLTGLRAGIPVAGGASDAYISLAGINVLSPGRIALITGSSQLQMGLSASPVHAKGLFGSFPDAIVPGFEVVEAGQVSTGSVLKWFVTHFVGREVHEQAARSGRTVYQELDEQAKRLPPGSEGLVVLEHWQGNRTPWTDPTSRGVIRGLTLRHTAAHLYRAIMEAAAYATRIILDLMHASGIAAERIIACGGATKSELWMQIISDVCDKPISLTAEPQAAALGSAIAAAVASGVYADLPEAASHMVRTEDRYHPDEVRTSAYAEYIRQYRATYEALKDESKRLASLVNRA